MKADTHELSSEFCPKYFLRHPNSESAPESISVTCSQDSATPYFTSSLFCPCPLAIDSLSFSKTGDVHVHDFERVELGEAEEHVVSL